MYLQVVMKLLVELNLSRDKVFDTFVKMSIVKITIQIKQNWIRIEYMLFFSSNAAWQ